MANLAGQWKTLQAHGSDSFDERSFLTAAGGVGGVQFLDPIEKTEL